MQLSKDYLKKLTNIFHIAFYFILYFIIIIKFYKNYAII